MNQRVYLCDDSIDGILTGIYDAWSSKYGYKNITLEVEEPVNYQLFTEYILVQTDFEKANKVAKTIKERMGQSGYEYLCYAMLSYGSNKADAIYKTVVMGIGTDKGARILDELSNPYVFRVFELKRNMYFEQEHFKGFTRFAQLKNGVLLAQISPKNNVLTIISPHFENRLPNENWMIYDQRRKFFAIHEKNKNVIFVSGEYLSIDEANGVSEEELLFQELWTGFCNSICIKERENINLQRHNLPLRFRENMVEFY